MLVLTRKIGEVINIGKDIRITVTKINGGRVGIGIEAPPSVLISREEIMKIALDQNFIDDQDSKKSN